MTRPDFTITADDAREIGRVGAGVRPAHAAPGPRPGHRTEEVVPIPCGSTREAVCPACARKARIIRIQQCTEGWHLTDEPDRPTPGQQRRRRRRGPGRRPGRGRVGWKRVRSTRRRQNLPDLPSCMMVDRTVGQVFTAPVGQAVPAVDVPHLHPALLRRRSWPPGRRRIRHSMTTGGPRWTRCTSPSCAAGSGPTCAAAPATTCSTSPSSKPNAGWPRICTPPSAGAIPRAIFRQVVEATDYALWWPPFDQAVYVDRLPVWTGPEHGYADPDTGEILPTWDQALDQLDNDPDAKPAHVMRFGKQLDLQGVIPEHADQAVRYLTKYLTKAIGETHADATDHGL